MNASDLQCYKTLEAPRQEKIGADKVATRLRALL
jgi:hypothetical protein